MVYLAEFAVVGTLQLADEILIYSDSKEDAQLFALHYASNWGMDFHSLRLANEQHIQSASRQRWMHQYLNQSKRSQTKKTERKPNFLR